MGIMVGSARHDEDGKYVNGAAGDQLQKSTINDTLGEVSMQPMYTHSKGWYILRPKGVAHANAIAALMKKACNNPNIGYDQYNRLGIVKYGTTTNIKTECDCSSLVRQIVEEATGKDPGDFITSNEAAALEATGIFEKRATYVSQVVTPVYDGDVLVTKTKGHTVVVTSGNARQAKVVNLDCTVKLPSLVKGECGGYVKTLQQLLVARGYDTNGVDGIFGAGTEAAVSRFQADAEVKVSYPGTVGSKTWAALFMG